MALGINTNVASINAQNQLSKSQSQNDQALERLSSGLRINSAKDDAAGLAISTRFDAQVNGLNQASRNANDGISLSQTAEGGLDEITNNLQRVRELSVQSANATNNDSDREALNDEVQQRLEEIDRIASQTSFNGLNVLDGSLDTKQFQVGANAGQTIGVDLSSSARLEDTGTIALAEGDLDASAFSSGNGSFNITVGDAASATSVDIDVDDDLFSGGAVASGVDDSEVFQQVADQINEQADVFASVSDQGIDIRSDQQFDISGASSAVSDLSGSYSVTDGSLEGVTVDTVDNANDAIMRIDSALDQVNGFRGELGAIQNRFESTISNLDNNIENLEASNSRIKDADFASESAKLSQSQVLQQAGISVLSQANQRPQQVLSLLQ